MFDFIEIGSENGAGLFPRQRIEGVFDVSGPDRVTVRKMGFLVDMKLDAAEVLGGGNVVGDQSILGICLVEAVYRKGVEHQVQDYGGALPLKVKTD